jgi:3-oxoadipate enol-lactonase
MIATSKTVAFRGSTLRYWIHGSAGAPWLVMSHGMALDSKAFEALADRLASKWRVLRWDLPGHGESGAMPEPLDMSVCVDALEAVLDDAGADRAVLLGFSFGGMVSQLFAHRKSNRVDGLIAYGCFSPLLVKSPPAWVKWLAEKAVMRGSWEQVRTRFAKACSIKDDVRRNIAPAVARVGAAGFRTMTRALLWVPDHDPAFRVAGPVLWVQGVQDSNPLKPVEAALRKNHPNMRSEIIPDAGHCAHQDNPAAFNAAIERFLDDAFPSK